MAIHAEAETYDLQRALAIAGFDNYQDYLRSPHWADIRRLWVASGFPTCCVACGSVPYELHHLTYTNLGHEALRDLLPLCGLCHDKIHDVSKTHTIPLEKPHRALMIIFGWRESEAVSRLAEIAALWVALPNGEPRLRARLVRRRFLVQCHRCGKRGWQSGTTCGLCTEPCEVVLDWH